MQATRLSALVAAALLAATTAFAAPGPPDHRPGPPVPPRDYRPAPVHDYHNGPDRFDRDQNYGFERNYRATPAERRRWEAAHNYGYPLGHRVTRREQARWEASYRR